MCAGSIPAGGTSRIESEPAASDLARHGTALCTQCEAPPHTRSRARHIVPAIAPWRRCIPEPFAVASAGNARASRLVAVVRTPALACQRPDRRCRRLSRVANRRWDRRGRQRRKSVGRARRSRPHSGNGANNDRAHHLRHRAHDRNLHGQGCSDRAGGGDFGPNGHPTSNSNSPRDGEPRGFHVNRYSVSDHRGSRQLDLDPQPDLNRHGVGEPHPRHGHRDSDERAAHGNLRPNAIPHLAHVLHARRGRVQLQRLQHTGGSAALPRQL